MIPSPDNQTSFKTAKKVFRYDDVLTDWGWSHDVYYDALSEEYFIANFPQDGHMFEISVLPTNGPAEITVQGTTYRVRVYEQ
jgi:hypothetical protein